MLSSDAGSVGADSWYCCAECERERLAAPLPMVSDCERASASACSGGSPNESGGSKFVELDSFVNEAIRPPSIGALAGKFAFECGVRRPPPAELGALRLPVAAARLPCALTALSVGTIHACGC